MNISTVISNVAGPDFPLYCAGARMVDYYGLGVLTPGIGIFHLVFSYSGTVTLSVLADREIMPNPELYHDCLVASYEELYAATLALRQPADSAKAKAAVKAKAKIDSPRRASPEDAKTAKSGKKKSSKKPKGSKKTKTSRKPKPKAATKTPAKSKAKPARKAAPIAASKSKPASKKRKPIKAAVITKTARPKAVRRKQASAPKLKASS